MPLTWADKMDQLLVTCLRTFGRTADDPRGQTIYRRTGYAPFSLTGILTIDPRLQSVDLGKYYAVTFRLKDFDEAPFAASVTVTFDGLPSSGNTVTFDGVTYTYRTSINDAVANEVWRAGNAVDCARGLAYAINRVAEHAGSWYSAATIEHPTCVATHDSQSVRVEYKIAGTVGNNKVASESLHSASLNSKLFTGGGPLKADEVTIDGLDYKVGDVGYDSEGGVTLRLHLKDTASA